MTWAGEPELVGEYLIAPELEPELVGDYLIDPELVLFTVAPQPCLLPQRVWKPLD